MSRCKSSHQGTAAFHAALHSNVGATFLVASSDVAYQACRTQRCVVHAAEHGQPRCLCFAHQFYSRSPGMPPAW